MRALRFDGRTARFVTDAPEPVCAPGEAVIKPTKLLVSPADLVAAGMAEGFDRAARPPNVLGSQFVGVIKKINLPSDTGPALAARKNWVGKRVVASPTLSCAACDLCRSGLAAHCRSRKVLGISERDGCFADQFCMPLASLALVSDSVSDEKAVFAHPLSGALHAVNMLRGESNSFITVLGDSVLALLTAQALARINKSVRVLSSRPDRQRLCERWGVKHRSLEEPGRRQDQDVVVDCTGTSAGLRLAMQFVRPRGTILLKGPGAIAPFPAGRPLAEVGERSGWYAPVDLTPLVVNEIQLIGSRDGPIPDAIRMLSEDAIDVTSLISKRCKLEEVVDAMRAAQSPEHVGVVIDV